MDISGHLSGPVSLPHTGYETVSDQSRTGHSGGENKTPASNRRTDKTEPSRNKKPPIRQKCMFQRRSACSKGTKNKPQNSHTSVFLAVESCGITGRLKRLGGIH
jgi:hypothetical protein